MRPSLLLLVFLLKFMDCTRPDSEDNGFAEKIEKSKILRPNLHERLATIQERILGNPKKLPLLQLPKKDIVGSAKQKRCQICMESIRCKTLNKCDHCDKFCQTESQPEEQPEPVVGIRLKEDAVGDSAAKPSSASRYYTVGSFGPGPKQDLLARLLNIAQQDNLEKLVVLAKPKGKGPGGRPLIIDTAGVFQKGGNGIEVHEVKGKNSPLDMRLTSMIDHELEKALAQKDKLNDKLVDKIIDKVLKGQRPERLEKRADLGSRMLGTPHITTKRSISPPKDLKAEDGNHQGFQGKLFPAKSPPGNVQDRTELVPDDESDSSSSEEEPPVPGPPHDQQPSLSERSNFRDEDGGEKQPNEARQAKNEKDADEADNDEDQIVTLTQPPDVSNKGSDDEVVGSWLEDETDKASKWYHDKIGLRFDDQKSRSSQNSDNALKPDQFLLLLQNLAQKVENVADLVKKTCGHDGETVGNAQPKTGDQTQSDVSDHSRDNILKSLEAIQSKTSRLIDEAQDNVDKVAQDLKPQQQVKPEDVGAAQPKGDQKVPDFEGQVRMIDPQERMSEGLDGISATEENNKLEPQEPTVACSNEDSGENYRRESKLQVESRFKDIEAKADNDTVACSEEDESDQYSLGQPQEKTKNKDLEETKSVSDSNSDEEEQLTQRMKLPETIPELNDGKNRPQVRLDGNVAKTNDENEQPGVSEKASGEVGCSKEESDEDEYLYPKGTYRISENRENPIGKSTEEKPLNKLKSSPKVKPLHELLHPKDQHKLPKLLEKPDNKPAAHGPHLFKTLEDANIGKEAKERLLMNSEERKPAAAHRPKFLKTVPFEEQPTDLQSGKLIPAHRPKAVERLLPDMIHTDEKRPPLRSEAHRPNAFRSNDEQREPLRPAGHRPDIFRSKEMELPPPGQPLPRSDIFRSSKERESPPEVLENTRPRPSGAIRPQKPRFRLEEERPKRPPFFTRRQENLNKPEEERPKRPPLLSSRPEDFNRNEERPPHFGRTPEEERPMPEDFNQGDGMEPIYLKQGDSELQPILSRPMPSLRQRFGEDPTLGAKKDLQELPDNVFGRVIPQNYEDGGSGNMPDKVYFVGTGMHLPLNMKKQNDGSYQITVDVKNLCKKCAEGTMCSEPVVGMKAPQISAEPEEQSSHKHELRVKRKNIKNPEDLQPLHLSNAEKDKVISQRSMKSLVQDLLDDLSALDVDAEQQKLISHSGVKNSNEKLPIDFSNKTEKLPVDLNTKHYSISTLDEIPQNEEDFKQSEVSKRSPKFNMFIPSFNSYDSREDTDGPKKVNSMKSYNQNKKFNRFYEAPNNEELQWPDEEKSMIKKRVSIVNNVLNWMKDLAVN